MKSPHILSIIVLSLIFTATHAQKTQLFNGKDFSGWHVDVPEMDNNSGVKSPFIIRNGLLVSLGTPGGHLITDESYKNYRLEVQYRFAGKPGNCGVLVHASTPRALYKMFPKSLEVQMMHENAGDSNNVLVNYGFNCTADHGQIAVQAEGAEVEFRKIEITPITKLTK